MNERFDDAMIAKFALEFVFKNVKKYLKDKNIFIIVGNKQGDILATKSLGWESDYEVFAKDRFTNAIKTGFNTISYKGKLHQVTWIDGDVVVTTYTNDPYWDETVSREINKVIQILLTEVFIIDYVITQ